MNWPDPMSQKMLADWHHCFPDCEPVAHHLRVAFPDRWVRFHSLPESKRYPETEAEYAIVLERHNRVLGELAQVGETVALLTTGYSRTPTPLRSETQLLELDPNAEYWRTVAMHEIDAGFDDPTFWHLFVSEWQWLPGLFDPWCV
jgi:hypothetical protein